MIYGHFRSRRHLMTGISYRCVWIPTKAATYYNLIAATIPT